MNQKILQFRLTDHFMLRGWERSIDKVLLYKVLPFVKCPKCQKDIVFVLPSFLKRKGIERNGQSLILVLTGSLLKTAYWCKDPNYLFNKNDKPHYQILY